VIVVSASEIVTNLIREHNGVISTAEVQAKGLSRTTLSKLEREGVVLRIARGQYILPEELPDELYLWQQRNPRIIYSHETALFLHDITERTPVIHTITLPATDRLSPLFPGEIKVYLIKPGLFEMGLVSLPTKMGHLVRSYDVERTICDILRSRNKIDSQIVSFALKSYADRNDKDFNKLGRYAEIFHITKVLRRYLEVLL
jgi:predicted transcriptional regulator of viral defense system